jgi:hypothetical protein
VVAGVVCVSGIGVYQQVEESGEKSCDMVRERGEEREQM